MSNFDVKVKKKWCALGCAPIHGGDPALFQAIQMHLDLSTGVNPIAYDFKSPALDDYQGLPYLTSEFLEAAATYYGTSDFLACAGSETAITWLPRILPKQAVLLPSVGYQSHEYQWRQDLAVINYYDSLTQPRAEQQIEEALRENSSQHLVVINPNNPTGIVFNPDQLLDWAKKLGPDSYLIVDEAFGDLYPNDSLLSLVECLPENLVILRSFGKFFGLAGIRLGFVFSGKGFRETLNQVLGAWPVNGPAMAIATQALADRYWHAQAKDKILTQYESMRQILADYCGPLGARLLTEPGLFISYLMSEPVVRRFVQGFAEFGIGVRQIPVNRALSIIRFGLFDVDHDEHLHGFKIALDHLGD